jgi:hypothetical protein
MYCSTRYALPYSKWAATLINVRYKYWGCHDRQPCTGNDSNYSFKKTVSRCSKVSNLLHFDISLILNMKLLVHFPPRIVLKLTVILRMAQPMPKHAVLLNKLLFSCVLCVDFRNKTAASHTFLLSTAMWINSHELTIRSQVQRTVGTEFLRCAYILYRFLQSLIAKDASLHTVQIITAQLDPASAVVQ